MSNGWKGYYMQVQMTVMNARNSNVYVLKDYQTYIQVYKNDTEEMY